jgi:ubiquinone/menaquinone biosynthesis C-methylase UbiE
MAEPTCVEWDEIGHWYDEKQGDTGDLWHRALIDPPLFEVIGQVAGLRVLDLACGNGYISRRLARQGAQVIGIDASASVIERARERERREPLGISYQVADASRLDLLDDASFDLVVSNMALMDIADAAGALREVGRLLRVSGRFAASFHHPCFEIPNASAWLIEQLDFTRSVWRKVGRYRELATGSCSWRGPDGMLHTAAYHRPLSWYIRALREAGLVLVRLEEPEPTEEFLASSPSAAWITEVPLHCVIEAWKLAM